MKYYIVTIFLSVLFLSACTDLEYQAVDSIVDEGTGGATSAEAADLVSTLYQQLATTFGHHEKSTALEVQAGDDIVAPTRGTDWSDNGRWRNLHTHGWNVENEFIRQGWNDLNQEVFRANQALVGANLTPELEGEARFLRALYMSRVVNVWGVAPFRETSQGVDELPRVLTGQEAAELILSDLERALELLPECSDLGEANKNTARALLIKAHAQRNFWSSADKTSASGFPPSAEDSDKMIEYADAIINSSCGYALEEDYFRNFSRENNQSSELIFTIPHETGNQVGSDNTRNWYFCTLHYNQNPSGWNGFSTLSDFYNSFDDTDVRTGGDFAGVTDVSGLQVGFLLGQQFDQDGNKLTDRGGNDLIFTEEVMLTGNSEVEGIRVIKYSPDYDNINAAGNDFVIFRLADVILLKAEGHLRNGDEAAALELVNQVRRIRGVEEWTSLTLDDLLAERGRELYEEGWRRSDLIRYGKYLDEWQLKPVSDPTRYVYPIPPDALASNPNLSQNPGY